MSHVPGLGMVMQVVTPSDDAGYLDSLAPVFGHGSHEDAGEQCFEKEQCELVCVTRVSSMLALHERASVGYTMG